MENKCVYKIVADSSCDISNLNNVPFAIASLKISTAEREFVDDSNLNTNEMVEYLHNYKGKSGSSCPNPDNWLSAFGDAEYIFCVTMTSKLSGTYNSAMLAKRQYEERHPDRSVYVIDSLSTGPEMALIISKLEELIVEGKVYDEIVDGINEYLTRTGLLFMLESLRNLANNGRVSHITARFAGMLGIRLVGKATEGELEPLDKCRGEKKALGVIVEYLKEYGVEKGRINIAHCGNEKNAYELKRLINEALPLADVNIRICGGLCSFYAEKGGMLIGYERF